jgi:CRP-like cAMP-binding protein
VAVPASDPKPADAGGIPGGFLDELPWLADLRPDERDRIGARFVQRSLARGECWVVGADGPPSMGVVVAGRLTLAQAGVPGLGLVTTALRPGDRWGELALFTAMPQPCELRAETEAEIAVLDLENFRASLAELPILWIEIARRLSQELKWRHDLLREIREFDATGPDAASLDVFLQARRRRVARRAGVARTTVRALARRLVTEPARDPAFWMLSGFIGAVVVSRAVVAFILRFDLQGQLFNVLDSGVGNPIHIHHFTYGFVVLVVAGALAFFPRARRWLAALACAFGVGLGLVFDEFALIWNLHPDYYQRLNYQAQAALAAVLVQLVYFRHTYLALLTRLAQRLRPIS